MTPEHLPSGTSSPPTPRERLKRRATPNSSTPCSLIPKPAASGFSPTKNSNRRETALSPNAPQWTRLRNDLPLPPGTRYVLVTLHAMDAQSNARKGPAGEVPFPRHYLDDIQVCLRLGQPLP